MCRAWGTESGLPQNTVNAIVQTRDGYLWLGTQGGLARFDGVRFKVFGLAEGLPSVQVRSLFEDRRGCLWIGMVGGGLCRMQNGRFENMTVEEQFSGATVNALLESAAGDLWAGTTAGMALIKDNQLTSSPMMAALNNTPIRALFLDSQQTLWIAAAEGLYRFKDHHLSEQTGPAGSERITSAYCFVEDLQERLWVSIGNGMVLCRQNGEWTTYNETAGLPFAYITSLALTPDGTVWAGSLDDGLYFLDGDRFVAVDKSAGLSGNAVRSLQVDREGDLWVGMRTAGLNRLTQKKVLTYGFSEGLTNDYVRSVAESDDGTLWVGTTGGGLYRGQAGRFELIPNEIDTVSYQFIESVVAARDGSVWWAGAGGLFQMRNGRRTAAFTRANTPWLANTTVTAMLEDARGGLWIGTRDGQLMRFQNGRFVAITNHLARGSITAMAQDGDGTLFVGSVSGGVVCLRKTGVSRFSTAEGLLCNQIQTLHLDAEHVLWIGTSGGGLSRLRDGSIVSFTRRQGLGDDTISQILEDDDGGLWLGCNRGIFRVRKNDLEELAEKKATWIHAQAYGINDGMPVEECSGGSAPSCVKTKGGLLYFCTVRGLVAIDPRQRHTNPRPPGIRLEEVLINGQLEDCVPPRQKNAPGAENALPSITLSPGHRNIEIHYTGLSFSAPEKVRFRRRLENLDKEWIEAGTDRFVHYQRVPPGHYVFDVLACNADNVWTPEPVSLAVNVEPYFWETRWFVIFTAVALLGVLTGAARSIERRRYKRRLARLEMLHAVERERLRISQDMHDDIGSILTRVSTLSDLGSGGNESEAERRALVERIRAQVRLAVQALDEIVWATNPRNDNLPSFAEYLGRYADECFEDASLRCWQEIPTDLPRLPVPADVRHNIFLATKEALNNVLKHSGASEVWLRLSFDGETVHISIEDNGRGFTPGKDSSGGNGLANMRSRMAECGGVVQIETAPRRGTRIRFALPLRHTRAQPPG